MVEVSHDVPHTLTFLADEIRNRDFDVGELNECCACGDLTSDIKAPHADARIVEERNHNERKARGTGSGGANGHCAVVRPDAVCDPAFVSLETPGISVFYEPVASSFG